MAVRDSGSDRPGQTGVSLEGMVDHRRSPRPSLAVQVRMATVLGRSEWRKPALSLCGGRGTLEKETGHGESNIRPRACVTVSGVFAACSLCETTQKDA